MMRSVNTTEAEAVSHTFGIVVFLLCIVVLPVVVCISGVSTATATTLSVPALGLGDAADLATAVYGTPVNENLDILRAFRDTVLLTNPAGDFLVNTYYITSPPIATALAQNERLCTATRLLLFTPLVFLSALCLNMTAFAAFNILILIVLFVLRRYVTLILKGIGYGALTIAAFTVTVITLGAIGYELPLCAAIAANILPLIIPAAVAVCILTYIVSRPRSQPKITNYLYAK